MSRTTVIIVVTLLLLAPIGAATTVAAQTSASTDLPDGEIFEASDVVNVWQESVFEPRVQTGADETAVRVQNPTVKIRKEGDNTGTGSGKNFIATFDSSDTIKLEYDAKVDDLKGEDVQVIAAKPGPVDGPAPKTFSDALDQLTSENANQNASYYFVNEATTLDPSLQTTEFSFDPQNDGDGPGHYTFFVAAYQDGSPIDIDDDQNISIPNDITIIGGDSATVQRGTATVTRSTSNPQPGDSITFDVDASGPLGDGVTHGIAVYDKDVLEDSEHTIVIDESQLDSNFNIEDDSEFEHSIEKVDGTATVEDGASINGLEFSDGTVSRDVGGGAIIDFIGEELNGNVPPNQATDTTVLNASMDVDVDEDGDHTLEVQTNSDWNTGTYQYVYLSTLEDNKNAVSAQEGTFSISSPSPSPPPGPPSKTVSVSDGSATISFSGEGISGATISNLPDSVSQISMELPDENPSPNAPSNQVASYLEITPEDDTGSEVDIQQGVDVSVDVPSSTLSNIDTGALIHDPGGNGNWEELSTTTSGSDPVTLTATTNSGLSPFAVGEASSDDDTSDDDDGSSSSSGGGQSVGAPEQEEEQDDQSDQETAPTVDEVVNSVTESEPDTTENIDVTEVGRETEDGGVEVDVGTEGSSGVRGITFTSTDIGSVSVSEYTNSETRDTVAESIRQQLAQAVEEDVQEDVEEDVQEDVEEDVQEDVEGSAGEDIEGDTGDTSQDSGGATSGSSISVDVATVSSVEPDNPDASATITMSADRDEIEDPEQATIYKEGNNEWVEVPTEVEEVGDEEVTFSGDVESFSIFAVAEVTTTEETTPEQTDQPDETNETDEDDGGSGLGIVIGLLAVVAVAGAALYARQNDML